MDKICEYCKSEKSNENKPIYDDEATEQMSLDCYNGVWRIDCYGSVTGKINFCPMCGRPLNKTFPNELKADEKLCIKYEKEWIDECRKNENKIVPYAALPSEKVEELESLIRSAESIFEGLVNVGILSFFIKLKDHYEVAYRAF